MTTQTALETLQTALEILKNNSLGDEARLALDQANQAVQALSAELDAAWQSADAARQSAAAANQERLKFVSVVTHELRIPLTSMKGYTDLLRQGIVGPVNEQQKNFLQIIRGNVDRMSALISDLADMSHLQSGRLKLQPKITSLQAIMDEAAAAWQPKLGEKDQVLTLEIPQGNHTVMADHGRVVQVLGTLLNNANRYTPAGGKIRLGVAVEADAARFSVSDSGIGISEEDQARLFTPFFRSEHEAVREHPGWGLALHVASLLAGQMGGSLQVQSRLGEGSEFILTLPLQAPTAL